MGVLQSSNTLYLSVSCGALVNKKKGISTYGYEGTVAFIEAKEDEYEGKPIDKIHLTMVDNTGEKANISFTMESWYAIGFFQRIKRIDVTKQFTLGVSKSEQNEKLSFCWLRQPGKGKIEKDTEFPLPEKVTVGKKEVVDWTKTTEAMKEIITWVNSFERGAEQEAKHEPTNEPEPIEGNDLPF